MSDPAKEIRRLLEEAYRRPAWHGPNLKGALRGLDAAAARRRPGPGRPCIWQIALHCAYWKHRVRVRITGVEEPFPRPGPDWPHLPTRPDDAQWRRDVRLLDRAHVRLLEALADLSPRDLERPSRAHRLSPRDQLVGIALHDTYHGGQIRLIRKLQESRARTRRATPRRRRAS